MILAPEQLGALDLKPPATTCTSVGCGQPVGKNSVTAPYGLPDLCDRCWKSRRADAWATYKRYLRRGILARKPCQAEGCSKTEEHVEGHHLDYNEPLTVVFLCTTHHRQAHKLYAQMVAERRRNDGRVRAQQEDQAIRPARND